MKILETAYSAKNIAGGEIHLLEIVKGLCTQGHQVTVLCPDTGPLVELLDQAGAGVKIIPFCHSYDIRAFFKIARFIKKERFDIVHTHGLMLNTLIRAAAVFAGSKNIYSTVHLIQRLKTAPNLSLMLKIKFFLFCITDNILAKKTKSIIAVSEAVRADLIEQGIAPEKIHTVHNGINIQKFSISENSVTKEKLGLSDKFVLGIAGRIAPLKGHKELLEAYSLLQKKHPDIALIIAGDDISGGGFRDSLIKYAEENNLQNIIWTGFVKNIEETAAAFDVWCIPSWHEPFGLVTAEAMAMRKPVVATESGGIPEIIRNRTDGILVPPKNSHALAEAIEELMNNRALCEALTKSAYERVCAEFSSKRMIEKTLKIMGL